MKKKHTAYLTIKVVIECDDDTDVNDVISDLDYDIESMTSGAKIINTELISRE